VSSKEGAAGTEPYKKPWGAYLYSGRGERGGGPLPGSWPDNLGQLPGGTSIGLWEECGGKEKQWVEKNLCEKLGK